LRNRSVMLERTMLTNARPRALMLVLIVLCASASVQAASCVWRVTGREGGTLYLGGSWHALRESDYPLPGAFNRAYEASSRLAFEVNPRDLHNSGDALDKAGSYPKGDSLKKHVDPRTYAYLKRFFGLINVSESQFNKYRPWYLSLLLDSPSKRGLSENLGVEAFFERRARKTSKTTVGLETLSEHIEVFSGLSERGSEALLLLTFIPSDQSGPDFSKLMSAWRRGDSEFLTAATRHSFAEFPAMADRLLSIRNRNWIPKLEAYLHSGKTYFVVAGAAHMGGSDGVVALMRTRGWQVEQL
jgi:uncharacterized protein YbaP (TraB family)